MLIVYSLIFPDFNQRFIMFYWSWKFFFLVSVWISPHINRWSPPSWGVIWNGNRKQGKGIHGEWKLGSWWHCYSCIKCFLHIVFVKFFFFHSWKNNLLFFSSLVIDCVVTNIETRCESKWMASRWISENLFTSKKSWKE